MAIYKGKQTDEIDIFKIKHILSDSISARNYF